MKKLLIILFSICLAGTSLTAQTSYFADGYHGGVYGHYPLRWYTPFLVDQLRQHPDWRIGLEIEPETWDSVLAVTPQAYHDFRRLMQTPQVEVTNPTYAQPYLFNINGESIIRQFQYGMRKLESHFPGIRFTTYATEEPCFTSQLPQLLRLLGFRYVVLKNPDTCWGGYTEARGGECVRLIGPDGTSLLAVPRYGCEDFEPGSFWQTTAWNNSSLYLDACSRAGIAHPIGMCYQDAGWRGGPWLKAQSDTRYVCWTDYFEHIADTTMATPWHFTQEDIHPALMWGTQAVQQVARQVRRAEFRLIQAEKLAAMARLLQGDEPQQPVIDEAWRTLLLAQHHDAWITPYNRLRGYGTWKDAVATWTDNTLALADSVIAKVTHGGSSLCVYNTTGHDRHEVIGLNEGTYAEVTVPAFGFAPITQHPSPITHHPSPNTYELSFDLEHGGVISSLKDLQHGGREVAGRHFGELRGYFPDRGGFRSSTEQAATMEVMTETPLVKVIRIKGQIAEVPFTQVYTLRKGMRRIDVDLTIDWPQDIRVGELTAETTDIRRKPYYDTEYMLGVCYPPAFEADRLYKDAPFDICESRLSDTRFCRWDSIKNNVVLSWVDVCRADGSEGLALLTDHTTTYTHTPDRPLALTVQYAGPGLWNLHYPLQGATQLHFALLPHTGNAYEADIATEASNWNEPLLVLPAMTDNKTVRPLLPDLPKGCQLSSVRCEDGGVLMRLYHAERQHKIEEIKL